MKSPSWLRDVVVIWAPFERQKVEVHNFETANLLDFGTWKFTTKEDLNQRKQVFLLNLRLWPTQKPKIFFGKKAYMRKFCSVKARGFGLKISTLATSFACCSYLCRIYCRIYYYGLVAGMWHLQRSSISSFNSIIHQPKKVTWV